MVGGLPFDGKLIMRDNAAHIIKHKTLNFKCFMHKYLRVLIISLVGIIICNVYELLINPYILKFVGSILKI